ncbi:MAG: polysaccharide biosynthesis tyrosine autokinase [Cyanobacteria bacterium P01_D01_bin.123]
MTYSNSPEELDLQQYWSIVRRRWLPAAAVFSAALGLAALFTFLQEPIYESKGTLRVKSGALEGLQGIPSFGSDADALGRKSNPLETEALVIGSRALANEVIQSLDLRNENGDPRPPGPFLRDLNVDIVRGTDVLEVAYQSPDPEEAAKIANELMDRYIAQTIQNNRLEARAAVSFISQELPRLEGELLQAEATLRSFKEQNQIVDLAREAQSAVQVEANLNQQVVNARSSLQKSEASVEALRRQVGLVSGDEAVVGESLLQTPGIRETLGQLQEAETSLITERTRFKPNSPVVAGLQERRVALESLLRNRVDEALSTLPIESRDNLSLLVVRDALAGNVTQIPTESANIPTSSGRVGELRQNLTQRLASAEVERLTLQSSLEVLNREYDRHRQRMSAIPVLEEKLRELQRNLKVKQDTYETLSRNLQTIQVAENKTIGNARIIDDAVVSNNPVEPRESFNLALGGLLGIVLGAATALLLEARDRSVKTVSEAKGLLGYTLLGTIPLLDRNNKRKSKKTEDSGAGKVIVRDFPRSSSSESFRMLQANLKFLSSDTKLQVIVLTSSVPGEGKSTTSSNLAASLAELSHRVLIVDADMRRPRQHQIWSLPNLQGLSNVLVGQAELKTCIQPVMDNLDIMSAGVVPPNALSLLESQRMQALTREFVESYDYVIIDTPPLAVAADALVLGKLADGILLVVRPGVANVASVNSAKDVLEQSSQNVLGMVINGVLPENESDSYYYYYAKGYYADTEEEPAQLESKPEKSEAKSTTKVR